MVSMLILSGFARIDAQPVIDVELPASARGAAAISALGAHLPNVAKAYGMGAQELANLLRSQPSMGVDRHGRLSYACNSLAMPSDMQRGMVQSDSPSPQNALTAESSITQLAAGTGVDAFRLHSLPGATRVIYLDFDGHVATGTVWNSGYTGGADIVSAPFDLDGDQATFSAAERAAIESIWKRVAEDFAPFAINVTTQDPGLEGLRKSSTSDSSYGIRVVISPTNWYDAGAAGTAYVGSFSWNTDTPCWIFAAQLGNNDKYIGEVVSHEVGHTVGLEHDGVGGASPSEYYFGQGYWAPIMGGGIYATVSQFSRGEYSNATNTQDDLAIIANHAPLVSDDHGGTTGAASVLSGPAVTNGGTIETRADVDVFRFDTDAGLVSLNIASPSSGTNLHMKVELLNANGQILWVSDPAALSANIAQTLNAGTYYLRIGGVGFGSPTTDGYSDYGSIGNYIITGTLVPISGRQSPSAKILASTTSGVAALKVDFNAQGSTDPDGSILSYRWDFGNGDSSTAINPTYTYQTAGNYTAVLTVTDNDGLASSASVFVTVSAPANKAPSVMISASALSGIAPLPVVFSSAGSADPDGSIVSYAWTFGDGTTSTAASPSKTYMSAGNYTATLTVTDNAGATSKASVGISVGSDPSRDIDVSQYQLVKVSVRGGIQAQASVTVLDRSGRAVAGATVTIQWTGVVTGSTSAKTDATGRAILTSGKTKKAGSITGTIKSIAPPSGWVFVDSLFVAPTVLSVATK